MKINKILFVLIFTAYTLSSQVWLDPFINRDGVKLSEIQEFANQYFSTIDITQKGSGFKQYKRFEAFWKDRLMPDGTFPSSSLVYNEMMNANNKTKLSKVQSDENWKNLGPTTSAGGYSGLARVNCVRRNPHTGDLWAATPSGGIWKSSNNGNTWSNITDNENAITSLGFTSIAFHPTNSNIIYLASGDGDGSNTYSLGVIKSTDGGNSWNATGLSWNVAQYRTISKILIDPINPEIVYTAGSDGVYKSTDEGANWTQILTGRYKDLEFKPFSSNTLYVCGTNLKKTTDAGANWTDLTNGIPTSGITRIAIAVSKNSSDVLYVLIGNSNGNNLKGVYLSTDSGDSFSQIASNSPNMLGYDKAGGDTKGQAYYDLCIETDQDDWKKVIIGGVNLWRSTDSGTNWELSSIWSGNLNNVTTVHADQHDLWYDNTNNEIYVGNDGGVYKSTDFGENWIWIGSGIKGTQFYRFGISQLDSSIYIGGAQDNGTKVHKTNGTWRDAIGGDGFEALVDNEDANIMYGSLYYGAFYKSTNSGISFKRINDLNNDNNYDDINESGAWSTPFIQQTTNSNTIILGMNNVWLSRDKGDHFTKISNFNYGSNKLVSLAIANSDSNVIYASFNTRLYQTTDNGVTWNLKTRPGNSSISYIFVDNENSDKIWATNSGYSKDNKVFESTDGGSTWTNLSKNLPNLPVLTIVKQKDSKDKLWIGTDVGVYYIDDDMSDWVIYNTGLPNVIVNELEINYTDNQIYAATFGRGIWKVDIPSALEVPIISTPINDSFGNSISNLLVDWNDINGALKYNIQVSTNNDFSSLKVNDTVSISRYFLNNLDNFKKYYIRIKALSNHSQSDWSAISAFTTIIGRVTLISPTNNAISREITDKLTWDSSNGATEFEVILADNSDFNDPTIDNSVTGNEFDYIDLKYFNQYWWKIRGKDPSGSYGDWSFVRKFQTKVDRPTLIFPTNLVSNMEISIKFDWSDVDGADKYKIQISDNISFSNLLFNESVSNSEKTIFPLEYHKIYYWRVNAENQTKSGDWSEIYTFTTKIGSTTLKLPENKSINLDTNLSFLWNNENYADNYNFQLDNKNTFDSPNLIFEDKIENKTNIKELLFDTTYYWRTNINVNSQKGEWSEIWSFRTKLKEPTLILPNNQSTDVPLEGNLNWSNSAKSSYRIQISEDIVFNNLIKDELINSNDYNYSNLKNDKQYFWRVRAERGQYLSDWSEIFSFNTPSTIDRPQLTYPNNLQRNLKLITLNLKWLALQNVTSYNIQIATDNNFSNLLINESNIIPNNYNFTLTEYNQVYYWRIQAIRSKGNESEWSETWEFSTTLPIPTLIIPINNAVGIEKNSFIEWNSVEGANNYNIEVANDNQFLDKVNNLSTKIGDNKMNLNGLENDKTYYWHVNAENNIALSEWSETWSFTIEKYISYVTEDSDFDKLKLTPNPFNDETTIEMNLVTSSFVTMYLTDLNGKRLMNLANKYLESNIDYNFKLKRKELSVGIYFLIIDYNSKQKSIKLIIN